ncbi:aminotransferase class V-fold PLP-dependent enzyme [Metamycoplasma arthritidis]|nr:aminotransferase class V-fold PLP-dependent enzyme [Metamycoplasma arthritidis]
MFKFNKEIVYLDNAALTFKPYEVIDEGNDFYAKYSISTRTADSVLGIAIAKKLQEARQVVASLVDSKPHNVTFTSGTTESLNIIISMLAKIIDDGEILLSYLNHDSNSIPFFENFKGKENIKFVFATDNKDLLSKINKNTKIIALSQATNNFTMDYNLDEIYQKAKENGAIVVNDAAQAIAHEKVSLNNCDVIAFSANKIYGPTGSGALVIKDDLLKILMPTRWGGGQAQTINGCVWTAKTNNLILEVGTPNFAGIFQLKKAIEFLNKIDYDEIDRIETKLANYLYKKLQSVPNIKIESKKGAKIVLFNIGSYSSQDVASYLGHKNVYVRAGGFCAHMVQQLPEYNKTYVRISLSFYNDKKDIDTIVELLKNGGNFLEFI